MTPMYNWEKLLLVTELSAIAAVLFKMRALPWLRRKFPSKRPRYLGTSTIDSEYQRFAWYLGVPTPLDPLTVSVATHPDFFGFVADEREHGMEHHLGVFMRGDRRWALDYSMKQKRVLAIFRSFDEYNLWRQHGRWPHFTGAFHAG